MAITAQLSLDDIDTRDLLIKSAPNKWFNQLTNDGSDAKSYSLAEVKKRFTQMKRRERCTNRQEKSRNRSPNPDEGSSKKSQNKSSHYNFCDKDGHISN